MSRKLVNGIVDKNRINHFGFASGTNLYVDFQRRVCPKPHGRTVDSLLESTCTIVPGTSRYTLASFDPLKAH